MPGEPLYTIVDLSQVWLIAEVFEQDLASVAVGQTGRRIDVKAYPGRTFTGRVAFIYPTVGGETRTARVRIEIANPDGLLEGAHVRERRHRRAGRPARRRRVPNSAVIDSGSAAGGAVERGDGPVRTAPGPARRARRRFRRGPRWRSRGRARGHQRQLPDRRRKQSARGAAGVHRRGAPALMIAGLIRWSAHNVVLVLIGTVFVILAGVWSVARTPLDAIPDLSDVQVIVYTEFPGQAPQVVEDQVTYPLTTALLSVPRSKVVRGFSFFGVSFVYVIFEDGTDLYWARSRVLEYLNFAAARLPAGVRPSLGPDATGVGWVYQYAVLGEGRSLAELRSLQDWQVRYALAKAEGVAEVASIGGFVKTYTVTVDPRRLKSYGIPLSQVTQAIRQSNRDVGGRVIEMAETEYVVRGRGYLRGIADLEQVVLKADALTPVRLADVARIELGPDERRGLGRTERRGRGGQRHRSATLRPERTRRDRRRQAGDRRARAQPAGGCAYRDGLRPLRADQARHRHAAHDADRGEHHRRLGVRRLPAARPFGAGGDHHAADRRADGVHRHEGARHRLQHHEPGRHRHRHRGDGGCGDRHDRERAQAPGAGGPGEPPTSAGSCGLPCSRPTSSRPSWTDGSRPN